MSNNETLRTLHAQAQAAYSAAESAEEARRQVAFAELPDMERGCASLVAALKARGEGIERELRRRFAALFASPVLQMRFTGGGQSARIVVSAPDRRCGEPHISETQRDGLVALLGVAADRIRVDGEFSVAVRDRYGMVCAMIANSGS